MCILGGGVELCSIYLLVLLLYILNMFIEYIPCLRIELIITHIYHRKLASKVLGPLDIAKTFQ